MRKISKILSVLLALLMVVTIIPMSNITVSAEDIPTSGTCGENLTWEFDPSTGTLTISGTGAMYDYIYISPWEEYEDVIVEVVIYDGVTTIGEYAFSDCEALASVTIPDSVTTIGVRAFCSCNNLTTVIIPDSVMVIGYEAFYGTAYYNEPSNWENSVLYIDNHLIDAETSITGNYVIKGGTLTLAESAFSGCTSLTSITIPDSVTTIGEDAFEECTSLESLIVDNNNQYYSNDEYYVLFNKDKTELIQYPVGKTDTSYTISDTVTTIGDCAFCLCTSLTSVTLGDSVTIIGDFAFGGCTSLTSIIIPDGVTTIGAGVFQECYSLTRATIPNSVTIIGDAAFYYCTSLTNVTIPNSITTISDYVFSACVSLTSIVIPDSVTSIGAGAFYYCTSLTSIVIPDSVTSIEDEAFYTISRIKNVYYAGSEEQFSRIKFGTGTGYLGYATLHFNFDIDSYTGVFMDYLYIDGVRQKAYQLVEFEGDYYFINDGHKIAKNKRVYLSQRFVEGTDLKVGYYDFDADGKMILLNGPVGDYFYKDNVRLKAYQLVEFEGNYYFINDSHKLAKNKRIYLSERFVEGTDLKVGYYEFDAEGKMVYLNGPVGDYFYKDNVRLNAYQLVEFEGNYYFINDSHKLAKNKRIYLSQRFVEGTDLKVGYYEFDAEGKMVYLNGPVGDYFYKDNVRLSAYQLVEFEGEFYFVYNSHKLAKNTRLYLSERFVEGTDFEVGYYNFDADGKLVIE